MQIKVKNFSSEVFKNKSGDFIFCLKHGKDASYKIIKREIIFDLILDSSSNLIDKQNEEFFEINKEEKKAIEIFLNKKIDLIRADLRLLIKTIKKLKKEEIEEKEKKNKLKKD